MPPRVNATMFGSLSVHTQVTSCRIGSTYSTYRRNRSAASARRHPPCSANHSGSVMWYSVTIGSTPYWRQVSIMRR